MLRIVGASYRRLRGRGISLGVIETATLTGRLTEIGRGFGVPMSLFDENAAILRDMEDDGSDLGPSRRVDFAHIFPNRAAANAFAGRATQDGFEVMVEEVDRADDPWDVTASKDILPSAENIKAVEERLAGLVQEHGGMSDGWGFERA